MDVYDYMQDATYPKNQAIPCYIQQNPSTYSKPIDLTEILASIAMIETYSGLAIALI